MVLWGHVIPHADWRGLNTYYYIADFLHHPHKIVCMSFNIFRRFIDEIFNASNFFSSLDCDNSINIFSWVFLLFNILAMYLRNSLELLKYIFFQSCSLSSSALKSNLTSTIDHFRVALNLIMKASLSAKFSL